MPGWGNSDTHPLWALHCSSLLRYSFLDEFADDPDFAMRKNALSSSRSIQDRIESCRIRISGRCKGLLEFRPYVLGESHGTHQEIVRFTHRLIPEFLENYIPSYWKECLSQFDLFHAYTSTLIASLEL